MAKDKITKPKVEVITPKRKSRTALDPETREKQMINLAMDRAEEQLRDGTASSAVITHFLKLGTQRQEEELELLRNQKTLVKAKAEQITHDKKLETITTKAIEAMKSYGPSTADNHHE